MLKTVIFGACTLFLVTLLPAQRLVMAMNDKPAGLITTTSSPYIQAIYYKTTRPMVLYGAEFWCGATGGTGSVYLFADDPTSNPSRPGKLLGSGTFNVAAAKCWAGATFAVPVPVMNNQVIWLGWVMSRGGTTPQVGRSATAPTYYWTKSLNPVLWNGPYGPPKQSTGFMWMYRLYEVGGTGKFVTFGTGKPGSHGPIGLEGRGWPNTGNPITLVASNLKNQSSGILIWGRKVNMPLPIGPVYSFPPLVIEPFTTLGGKTNPEAAIFTTRLPTNAALVGLSLSWQIWMLDPGAKDGIANSLGLEGLIG